MGCRLSKILTMASSSTGHPKPRPVSRQPRTLAECAALLKQQGSATAALALQDLQAYWLQVMMDKSASTKDKLTASKLYAESIGGFDKQRQDAGRGPAVYTWALAIDAEITQDAQKATESTTNKPLTEAEDKANI